MKAKRRLDYAAPDYTISDISLNIALDPTKTKVVSQLHITRTGNHTRPLKLNGEGLVLENIVLDANEKNTVDVQSLDYTETDAGLQINGLPNSCILQITNFINPAENTALEGLYLTNGSYCTQCEAEGFRRITYYLDRPDVLATYTVTISAEANSFPYLLSNGNKVSETVVDDVRTVVWHDPYPKPSYLFALVAGDFDVLNDSFITTSGKNVALQLFVDKGQLDKSEFAMQSLKRAMKWDENTFGLEYDLDIYMIVAVDFFNMGAMENKGLNVFNSKFILANDQTATDTDHFNIEAVVAHEYFHNWTGNRVTCRDWFQLSLKEGLTVFRDQLFSADMTSKLSTRIDQVKVIKEHQFPEDASAMSHPIRPDEVVEMNNFYTVTVYDKGAEVIRMLWNIIGEQAFKAGLKIYFERHDGQAVTCDDFVNAMQSATDIDLTSFRIWYSQSGTPQLSIVIDDDSNTITVSQSTLPTADQSIKKSLPILLNYSCYTQNGESVSLNPDSQSVLALEEGKMLLTGQTATLTFPSTLNDHNPIRKGNESKIIATFLGNFSSPVNLEQDLSSESLAVIAQYDNDAFNRWDAIQRLCSAAIDNVQLASSSSSANQLNDVFDLVLKNALVNIEETAEFLGIPSIESLILSRKNVDVHNLCHARTEFLRQLSTRHYEGLIQVYQYLPASDYQYNTKQVAIRRLRKALLNILSYNTQSNDVIASLYKSSDNMTDTLTALGAAQISDTDLFDDLMANFEEKWRSDSLVIDKWFSLQATTNRNDILSQLTMLQQHPRFDKDNPNRVRSVIGSFAFYNKPGFHNKDNSGYKYLTDYLIQLDAVNPQVASRLVTPLSQFQNLASHHEVGMREQLSRLMTHKGLSKDLFEKVSKALAYEYKA